MNHLDLFSGIGGFSLAADWVWGEEHYIHSFVEIDPFCQKVLKKHWPDVPIHSDIKDYKHDRTTVDLITGGVPCQPASVAGKRKGKEDNRWLWPETFRIISEAKPTWCILENVSGLLALERGLVFEHLLAEMESQGYEVQSFIIPACSVNAPHRRDRVWIVAYSLNNTDRTDRGQIREKDGIQEINRPSMGGGMFTRTACHASDTESNRWDSSPQSEMGGEEMERGRGCGLINSNQDAPYTDRNGLQEQRAEQQTSGDRQFFQTSPDSPTGQPWEQTEQEGREDISGGNKDVRNSERTRQSCGIIRPWEMQHGRTGAGSNWFEVATRLCRVDDGVRNRVDRLKCLGNAIVPQVCVPIMQAIKETNNAL